MLAIAARRGAGELLLLHFSTIARAVFGMPRINVKATIAQVF
jgi:hypothetical protein